MQGAGLYQAEVGDQRAHVRGVLDTPQHVLQRRVVLVENGRLRGTIVIHQHVHVVAQVLLREDFRAQWYVAGLLAGGHEIPDFLGDVAVRGIEELQHPRVHRIA